MYIVVPRNNILGQSLELFWLFGFFSFFGFFVRGSMTQIIKFYNIGTLQVGAKFMLSCGSDGLKPVNRLGDNPTKHF